LKSKSRTNVKKKRRKAYINEGRKEKKKGKYKTNVKKKRRKANMKTKSKRMS
jgi:hypothetical protein